MYEVAICAMLKLSFLSYTESCNYPVQHADMQHMTLEGIMNLQVQLQGALKVAWQAAPPHLARTTFPSEAMLPMKGTSTVTSTVTLCTFCS